MKSKILLLIVVVAAGLFFVVSRRESTSELPAPGASTVQVEWLTDFKQAQQRALTENKPLLLDFTGSDWCPPCKLLEKQVFSQPEFADYAAKHLVLVKIDFPRRKSLPAAQQAANDALAQRFLVQAFPTILAMAPDGKLKGQVSTDMFNNPAKFIAELEQVLRRT